MPRIRLSRTASVTRTQAGVLLRSDLGTFEISGADIRIFIEAVIPLLDGSRERDAVAEALDRYSRRSVDSLLDLLQSKGLIEELSELSASERWRGQDEFFRTWSLDATEARRRLASARVVVAGLSPWGTIAAREIAASGVGTLHLAGEGSAEVAPVVALESPWCRVTAGDLGAGGGWDLIVGAMPRGEIDALRSVARFAHEAGAPSLWGSLDGSVSRIGPAVVPGKTACFSCVWEKQLFDYDLPGTARRDESEGAPRASDAHAHSDAMAGVVGHSLALAAIELLSRYAPSGLVGRVLVQDLVSLKAESYTAVRVPGCRVCGEL